MYLARSGIAAFFLVTRCHISSIPYDVNVALYWKTLAPHVGPVWPGIKSLQHFLACVCQANLPPSNEHLMNGLLTLLIWNRKTPRRPPPSLLPPDVLRRPHPHLWDNYKHPASHLSPTIKQHGRRRLHKRREEGEESGRRRMRVEWSRVNSEKERGRLTAQLGFLILCLSGPVQSLC